MEISITTQAIIYSFVILLALAVFIIALYKVNKFIYKTNCKLYADTLTITCPEKVHTYGDLIELALYDYLTTDHIVGLCCALDVALEMCNIGHCAKACILTEFKFEVATKFGADKCYYPYWWHVYNYEDRYRFMMHIRDIYRYRTISSTCIEN